MDINSFVIGYTKGKASGGGGGAELNIAYGDTAPEDTSKLWCKTAKPSRVLVTDSIETVRDYKFEQLLSNVNDPRISASYCVYDNKIYIFGGNSSSDSIYKSIACYDIKSKTYTTLGATLPTALCTCAVARSGQNIYIIGGITNLNDVSGHSRKIYRFNAESHEIVDLGNKLSTSSYYFTNFSNAEASKAYIFATSAQASTTGNLLCFDAETEQVTTVFADYPKGNFNGGAQKGEVGLYDGHRYLYYLNKDPGIVRIDTITWETESFAVSTSFAYARGAGVVGNYIFVIKKAGTPTCVMVDLKADEVTTIPSETLTSVFGSSNLLFMRSFVTVGSKIYIMPCYQTTTSALASSIVATISPPVTECNLDNGTLLIVPQSEYNTFPIINTDTAKVEVGVKEVVKGNSENIGEPVETALYKDGTWTNI